MTRLLLSVPAVIFVLCIGGVTYVGGEEATGSPSIGRDLHIAMSSDKQLYRMGECVTLKITFTNTSDYNYAIGPAWDRHFRITRDGELIEDGSTKYTGHATYTTDIIYPHQSRTYDYPINQQVYLGNKFMKSGKYTVQVSWPIDRQLGDKDYWNPDPRLNFISNVVEFEILPPEGTTQEHPGENHTEPTQPQPEGTTPAPEPAGNKSIASSTWPWYTYALIALGVLIIGGAAYFILSKRKK